ncbi:MAG TPA: 30S ribosomal protein S7 [Thermoplasmata archaeon]|nr:30S ribosomal protein S7 [Thermoplasmata archaeon]
MEDPEPPENPETPEAPEPPAPDVQPSTPSVESPPAETPPAEGAEAGEAAVEAAPEAKPKKEAKKPRKRLPYQMKLFEKYDLAEVVVHDAGLAKYINLSPIVIPHTGGRWANKPFGRAKTNVVERLINNMMRTEDYTGKKSKSFRVVRAAFSIIEKRAGRNPVQVLVDALEKAAPREEITRLRFGGISVPRAVDISPSRRLDMAIRAICTGAVQATFKNRKPVEECLADEILNAAKGDMQSQAIAKKEELERVASSAR